MSALRPEADIRAGLQHVCFVPASGHGRIQVSHRMIYINTLTFGVLSGCSLLARPMPEQEDQ